MITVTSSEFRANQKKYFELAEEQPVYVTRSGKKTIVVSVEEPEDAFTEEEVRAIKRGLQQIKEGKFTAIEDPEALWDSI